MQAPLAWERVRVGLAVTVGASRAEVKFLCARAPPGAIAPVNYDEATMAPLCGAAGVVEELDEDLRAALVRFDDGATFLFPFDALVPTSA